MDYRAFKTEAEARDFMKRWPGSELLYDWATRLFVVAY